MIQNHHIMSAVTTTLNWLTSHLAKNGTFRKISFRGMSRKTECWMPVCGVIIRKVPMMDSREKCRINTFLMKNLFKDDPLMIAAGVHNNEPDPGLIQYYARCMNEDKSLYAMIDMTHEIIGVAIARHTSHSTARELQQLAKQLTYAETGKYMETLATVEEKSNIYRSYNSDKAWSIECLCTGQKFRRRGVAKILLKTSRELAVKDPSVNIMKLVSTNAYGSKAASNCGGMKVLSAKAPSDYRDTKGNILISNPMCPPHKYIELFVGELKRSN